MMKTPCCRFCREILPEPILDLGEQPLSNAYLSKEEIEANRERTYPLRLRVCAVCYLVQVDDAVAPEEIFDSSYAYFSSYSDSWLTHCREYAEDVIRRFALGHGSQVVEVASNDGYLLQFFLSAGVSVLGIEPTANTAAVARLKGIQTEVRFFNEAAGRELASRGVSADLIHGANVLAHVPDISDFVAGFPHILKHKGSLTLEFPHLLRMIQHVQFDTIYHEHFSYLSLMVVEEVLKKAGLRVYDLEELATHGGSLRLYCCHEQSSQSGSAALNRVRLAESLAGLGTAACYTAFANQVRKVRDSFNVFMADAHAGKLSVAAYGAAAKGNTFLNFCKVTSADIACVFDRNPHKQGKMLPGSHIPILDPACVGDIRPDFLLILPWNLKDEITEQMNSVRQWGCRFVTVCPNIEIIP